VNLNNIPYGEVIEVEQELIAEGLPEEEVFDLCDAHSAVLHGTVICQLQNQFPMVIRLMFYWRKTKHSQNPVLKRTVAKIATLQQAAAICGVKTEELINRLRKEVGQDSISGEVGSQYNYQKPEWFTEDKIVKRFNASEMLTAGEHPVNQVIADLNHLEIGKIYELKAPFLTAPLFDKSTSLGLKHWIEQKSDDEFFIYFNR
jgi:hypothetical protein